ncbi:hypothetical protein [Actinoplanes sp. NPDC051859]|uniref:hypothetical protein n=1 Tax=Actinoplanes sp. NPDC051859 TaxID=3363909 RepID=UPI0037A44C80
MWRSDLRALEFRGGRAVGANAHAQLEEAAGVGRTVGDGAGGDLFGDPGSP